MLFKNKYNDGLKRYYPKKKNWVFGRVSDSSNIINLSGDYRDCLPSEEKQRQYGLELMLCVSGSANNTEESILINYLMKNNKLHPSTVKFLKDNNYLDSNGKVNLNDWFLAKTSFTTKNGNTGNKVFAARRKFGAIPESMRPWTPDLNTWNKFYVKPERKHYAMGEEYNKRLILNNEIVYKDDFGEALKESPLQVYVDGHYKVRGGIYQNSNRLATHAVALVYQDDNYNYIFDTYPPFLKKFVRDYNFYTVRNFWTGKKISYGYKVKITEQIIDKFMIKTIKERHNPRIYLIDEVGKQLYHIGGMVFYSIAKEANWIQPFYEVDKIAKTFPDYKIVDNSINDKESFMKEIISKIQN